MAHHPRRRRDRVADRRDEARRGGRRATAPLGAARCPDGRPRSARGRGYENDRRTLALGARPLLDLGDVRRARRRTWATERPIRLEAVLRGAEAAGLGDDLVRRARPATRAELEALHPAAHLGRARAVLPRWWRPPRPTPRPCLGRGVRRCLGTGAGLDTAERLVPGRGRRRFLALRPQACATPAAGDGLLPAVNNSHSDHRGGASPRGERVVILDWDAHHGKHAGRVLRRPGRALPCRFHEFPLYPVLGTARTRPARRWRRGDDQHAARKEARPATCSSERLDVIVAPAVEAFAPTWLSVSARLRRPSRRPLAGLGLSSGDFADLTQPGERSARPVADAPSSRAATTCGRASTRPRRASPGSPVSTSDRAWRRPRADREARPSTRCWRRAGCSRALSLHDLGAPGAHEVAEHPAHVRRLLHDLVEQLELDRVVEPLPVELDRLRGAADDAHRGSAERGHDTSRSSGHASVIRDPT